MSLEQLNVLIVDDVNTIRVHVKELLKASGFKSVFSAGSVAQATEILAKEKIDLVLCDLHMEGPNGLEFLKTLRGNPTFADVAFVMVTAENTMDQILAAVQAGVDDYLLKPLTAASVQDKVTRALKKRKKIP